MTLTTSDLKRLQKAGVHSLSAALTMAHLHEHGATTMANLARAAGVTTGCITGLVDRLEKTPAFVQRHVVPYDRRLVLVALTEAGRALFEQTSEVRGEKALLPAPSDA